MYGQASGPVPIGNQGSLIAGISEAVRDTLALNDQKQASCFIVT